MEITDEVVTVVEVVAELDVVLEEKVVDEVVVDVSLVVVEDIEVLDECEVDVEVALVVDEDDGRGISVEESEDAEIALALDIPEVVLSVTRVVDKLSDADVDETDEVTDDDDILQIGRKSSIKSKTREID